MGLHWKIVAALFFFFQPAIGQMQKLQKEIELAIQVFNLIHHTN